jgi:hypothetical protein
MGAYIFKKSIPSMSATVFLSYSHKDMAPVHWLERLKMYLAPLRRSGDVEIWDDSAIPTGNTWRADISQAIQRSRVVILLVGPGFLASDFISNEELPAILLRLRQRAEYLSLDHGILRLHSKCLEGFPGV